MGLSSNKKPTKKELKNLFELSRLKDPSDFIDEFAQVYGSACEMWMSEEQKRHLSNMFYSKEYEFKCISGESYDGADDSAISRAERKGWTLLEDEQNGSSYDSIFFKTKKS